MLSLGVSVSSFAYAVWIDRYKYRGRPEAFVNRTAGGWEVVLKNHNSYSIQILGISVRTWLHGRPKSVDISAALHGRHEFPLFLHPSEAATVAIDKSAMLDRKRIEVATSSGRVGWRGQPRKRTLPIRIAP